MAEQQALNQQLFSKIEQMGAQLKEMESKTGNPPIPSPEPIDKDEDSGSTEEVKWPKKLRDEEQRAKPSMSFHSRIEFPQFDGSNPRSWI